MNDLNDSNKPESAATASLPAKPTRRRFLRRALGGATGLGLGALLYTWRLEPHWVEIVERPLPMANLPDALVGKRLVHLSDLHIGDVVDHGFITNAITNVARLEPDMIVITGDLMTCSYGEQIEQTLEVLSLLPKAKLGRFAVLGNHDYGRAWRQRDVTDILTGELSRLDINLLRNERVETAGLQVIGVDDYWAGQMSPQRALNAYNPSQASLLLCHNPDGVDARGMQPYNGWVLAGHTHGGQCKPPWGRPPVLPVENPRYVAGEVALAGGGQMYINRGLGYTHRVRFNCRPEITVFTLTS